MVRSTDDDTNFIDISAGILQENTFGLYMLIIWLDYMVRISTDLTKENGSH